MDAVGLRKLVGERLSNEMARKGHDITSLSSLSGIHEENLKKILAGQLELSSGFVKPLCRALNISIFHLLAQEYKPVNLHARSLEAVDRKNAGILEEVFYLLRDYLPSPKNIHYSTEISEFNDRASIIGDALALAEKVRTEWGPAPEAIIEALSLPVIPVKLKESKIEGCFLNSGDKSAIMLNTERPLRRMRFTLAHEIAHFLFDRDKTIPFDQIINIFAQSFDEKTKPEFIATKFAQFLLVPGKELRDLFYGNLPNYELAAQKCDDLLVSQEAMAFAISDYASFLNMRVIYRDVLTRLKTFPLKNNGAGFRQFIKTQIDRIQNILYQNKALFSETLLNSMNGLIRL